MFVQTFATGRSCVPPFLMCCLFEPNCAYNFFEGAEGRAGRMGEDTEGREGREGREWEGAEEEGKKRGKISRERRAELNRRAGHGAPPRLPPPRLPRRQPRSREGREGASSKPRQR